MSEDYLVPAATLAKLGNGDVKAGRRILRAMIDIEVEHEPINGPTEKPVNVRAAVAADEEAIMALLMTDLEENARLINPVCEPNITEFVKQAIRDNIATIGVVDGAHGLVALISIGLEKYWWTDHWSLAERVTFVHPDHRNSTYAADLIKFSKWFADGMSARLGYTVYLTASVAAPRDAYRKAALYGRSMCFMGGMYVYPKLPAYPI